MTVCATKQWAAVAVLQETHFRFRSVVMCRKLLLWGGGGLLLVGLVSGTAARSYVKTVAHDVSGALHDAVPVEFEIELKYFDGEPVIKELRRVSRPGRRVYSSVRNLPTVANGLGVAILSTPKGVMSDAKARAENVGGEVLCSVF